AVKADQHGQGPGPAGKWELDQDGQDDPLVPPAPGGVAVAGADRVAVAGLAVDLPAGGLGDGVIADQADPPLGPEGLGREAAQDGGQGQGGPPGQRQHPVVAGRVALGQVGDGAEQVGHGAPAVGNDGGDTQQLRAGEGGGGEGGAKEGEQGQLLVCYGSHRGL